MGITVTNPDSWAVGTAEDDVFIITDRGPAARSFIDGLGGIDSLLLDRSFDTRATVSLANFFGSLSTYGSVTPGDYYTAGHLNFYNFENFNFIGTVGNDSLSVRFDDFGLVNQLSANFGGGVDSLKLDFAQTTAPLTFRADTATITSSFGSFAGFEVFTIYGGVGNDEIRTGDGADDLRGGGGTNVLSGGGGNDQFFSVSITDFSDGGADFDYWQADFSDQTVALTIDIDTSIRINGTVAAVNFEYWAFGTGSGDDTVTIAATNQFIASGGTGNDLFNFRPTTSQFQSVLVNGLTNGKLLGSTNSSSFQDFERASVAGGSADDEFRVLGSFTPGQITFDGGAGSDYLIGQFEYLAGATSFVVQPDGSIVTNRGQFLNFERFNISGGAGADTIHTGAGNDNLSGGEGDDLLDGGSGHDVLFDGAGNDTLLGGAGDDILYGYSGVNLMFGGDGNDRLFVNSGGVGSSVDGGADTDTLAVFGTVSLGGLAGIEAIEFQSGAALTLTGAQFTGGLAPNAALSGSGSLTINMSAGDSELYLQQLVTGAGANLAITVNGSASDDTIKGALGSANTINGGSGFDSIRGGQQADTLNSGNGDDKLEGGQGADILTGGAGADVFRYQSANASGIGAAADRITDFVSGTDKLGFLLLDSDPVAPGQQGINYIDTQAFHATGAAEVRYGTSGADLLVQLDLNGDAVADMEILLQGLGGQSLASGDFLLNPPAGAQAIFVDSQQSDALDLFSLPPAAISGGAYADTMAFARFDPGSGQVVGYAHGDDGADFGSLHHHFENHVPTGSEFML